MVQDGYMALERTESRDLLSRQRRLRVQRRTWVEYHAIHDYPVSWPW